MVVPSDSAPHRACGNDMQISRNLYRADQVRELDRIAIEQFAIPGFELMSRAGCAAFRALRARWPEIRRIAVLCGTGNNGGDGFVLARKALEEGLDVTVYQVGDPARVTGDALRARELAERTGVGPRPWQGNLPDGGELLVDALLGTGLSGTVREPWAQVVEAINSSGLPVVALDIPSGLDADSGAPLGSAVRARLTVSFIALKQGLFSGEGPELCGEVRLEGLDVPSQVYRKIEPSARLLEGETALPPRRRTAHKGDFGHLLVVGGERGMSGAVRLAGEAALRCGAGLVSIATRRSHATLLNLSRPELMCHGVEQPAELRPLLERATAVVIGPGLGRQRWGERLLEEVLDSRLPLVVDADALNLLAGTPQRRDGWILTPHPGEAGRMLGSSAAQIQADRFTALRELQRRFGGVVVLKGAGTLILAPDSIPDLCSAGNPGMASGGMGDVLSGVIGALLVQRTALAEAARHGVLLHARAADRAACGGERGLLAADLMPHLRRLVN